MDTAVFTNPAGEIVTRHPLGGGEYVAFVPNPLPPPSGREQSAITENSGLLADAEYQLGQLVGIGGMVHDANALATLYLRQEAVRSSQIEGTHTSLLDLAVLEAMGEIPSTDDDARQTLNHVAALEEGLRRISEGAAIDGDLMRDLHRTLLSGTSEAIRSAPGEFRDVQNYIAAGGSVVYTPPPPDLLRDCLVGLFGYIGGAHDTPPLARIAWVHYAFEAIHPFRDGNGRVGRMLIALLLARLRRLDYPLLYLGSYFLEHRDEYYARLLAVSARSDWTGWLAFMLRAVAAQSSSSAMVASRLMALDDEWRARLEQVGATPTALRLAPLIRQRRFAVSASTAQRLLDDAGSPVSPPTAYQAIADLERAGILTEVSGRARSRVWVALELVQLFDHDAGVDSPPGSAPSH